MKKLIIITVLIFAFISIGYAETKKIPVRFTLSGEIKLGSDIDSYNAFADLYASLNLYVWKCKFSFFGGNLCWFQMDWNKPSGYPFRNIYSYGGRFEIAGFFIQAEHFCNHPVKSNQLHTESYYIYGNKYYNENQKWYNNFWGETITTVSVGYTFEFDIWKN